MRLMSRNQNGRNGSAKAAARLPLGEDIARPTFRRERAALKRGVWPVAGCDEAGRGPLAGPVVRGGEIELRLPGRKATQTVEHVPAH